MVSHECQTRNRDGSRHRNQLPQPAKDKPAPIIFLQQAVDDDDERSQQQKVDRGPGSKGIDLGANLRHSLVEKGRLAQDSEINAKHGEENAKTEQEPKTQSLKVQAVKPQSLP